MLDYNTHHSLLSMLTTNADKVSSDALCWSMNHILYKMQNNISEAVLTNSLQED